jgi:hypothetical protein
MLNINSAKKKKIAFYRLNIFTYVSIKCIYYLFRNYKVITVRRTDERWPFFHSCTNQLDLPRFKSKEALHEALLEALANGGAGGFSEFAHISSDNGEPNSNVDVGLQDRRNELLQQSTGLGRMFGGGGNPFGVLGGGGGGLFGGGGGRALLNRMEFESSGGGGGGGLGDGGLLGSLLEALQENRMEGGNDASNAAAELRQVIVDKRLYGVFVYVILYYY